MLKKSFLNIMSKINNSRVKIANMAVVRIVALYISFVKKQFDK